MADKSFNFYSAEITINVVGFGYVYADDSFGYDQEYADDGEYQTVEFKYSGPDNRAFHFVVAVKEIIQPEPTTILGPFPEDCRHKGAANLNNGRT